MNLRVNFSIELSLDGNKWSAMLGPNLAEGMSGWGDTPIEALEDLIRQIKLKTQTGQTFSDDLHMDISVIQFIDRLHRGRLCEQCNFRSAPNATGEGD